MLINIFRLTRQDAAAALTLLALSVPLMANGPASVNGPVSPQPVTVTNPVTVANPVTTVAVSRGSITIDNGPANPVPVLDDSGRGAMQHRFQCALPTGIDFVPCGTVFNVPLGKELVIEEVSVYGELGPAELSFFSLTTSVGPATTVTHSMEADYYDLTGTFAAGARVTQIYADGGTSVAVQLGRHAGPAGLGAGSAEIVISGRLVDQQ